MKYSLFNALEIFEFFNSINCLILELIFLNALTQYTSKYSHSPSSEDFQTVPIGFFELIILISIITSGFYCFAFDKLKKSDIGIHCFLCVLWILYSLIKIYYYVNVRISDFYMYDSSFISSSRDWIIRVGYNTYVTTILLGLTNSLFYFITMRIIWKRWAVGKSNDNKVSNNHEHFIDMEHIDEMDDSTIGNSDIDDDVEDSEVLIRISSEM